MIVRRGILLAVTILALFAGASFTKAAPVGAFTGPKSGHALYYSAGMMKRVGAVRIRQGLIPALRTDVDGYAAITDCSRIGDIAYASINGGAVEAYQIVDCSAPADVAQHVAEGNVIEVDYASAVRNGFASRGRAPATLLDVRPATALEEKKEAAKAPVARPEPTPTPTPAPNPAEAATIYFVNKARQAAGLPALRYNPALENAAYWHSYDLATRNVCSHNDGAGRGPAYRIEALNSYAARQWGEAVACHFGYDAKAVVDAWLASPAHRPIVLGAHYTEIGAGWSRYAGGGYSITIDVAKR